MKKKMSKILSIVLAVTVLAAGMIIPSVTANAEGVNDKIDACIMNGGQVHGHHNEDAKLAVVGGKTYTLSLLWRVPYSKSPSISVYGTAFNSKTIYCIISGETPNEVEYGTVAYDPTTSRLTYTFTPPVDGVFSLSFNLHDAANGNAIEKNSSDITPYGDMVCVAADMSLVEVDENGAPVEGGEVDINFTADNAAWRGWSRQNIHGWTTLPANWFERADASADEVRALRVYTGNQVGANAAYAFEAGREYTFSTLWRNLAGNSMNLQVDGVTIMQGQKVMGGATYDEATGLLTYTFTGDSSTKNDYIALNTYVGSNQASVSNGDSGVVALMAEPTLTTDDGATVIDIDSDFSELELRGAMYRDGKTTFPKKAIWDIFSYGGDYANTVVVSRDFFSDAAAPRVVGAQIREGDNALRFVMAVKESWLESLNNVYEVASVELGTILVNADAYTGTALERNDKTEGFGSATPTTLKNTKDFVPAAYTSAQWEGYKVYTAVITGVTADKQDINVAARAYCKVFNRAYAGGNNINMTTYSNEYGTHFTEHGGYVTTYNEVAAASAQ